MISAVVAMSKNGVIGIDGRLPWNIPSELKHFTDTTMGHIAILGRKTYEAIGKPLLGRENFIISRNASYKAPGCKVFSSLELAVKHGQEDCKKEIFICGGAKIYSDALFFTNRLYLTIVNKYLEGDTFFPCFDWREWREVSVTHHPEEGFRSYSWDLFVLDKKS